jgi:hypothetical protein
MLDDFLPDGDALAADFLGQGRLGGLHAVVDVEGVLVGVCADSRSSR